jgi:hypothetical protein
MGGRGVRAVAMGLVLAAMPWGAVVEAGALAKGAARGAARALAGKSAGKAGALVQRDRIRDAATAARPLPRDRSALRYTTRERARQEIQHGIPAGRHMAPSHRGRPPGAAEAQKRFGLPDRPEVREVVRLPKGFPVRSNKALGGRPGAPEWTSPRPVPPEAIKKVVPLRETAKSAQARPRE